MLMMIKTNYQWRQLYHIMENGSWSGLLHYLLGSILDELEEMEQNSFLYKFSLKLDYNMNKL